MVWGTIGAGLDAKMRAGLVESKDLRCLPTVDDVRSYLAFRLEHRGREADKKRQTLANDCSVREGTHDS
jgi:hypothetical protein